MSPEYALMKLHKEICILLGKKFRYMRLARGWSQEDMQEKGFSYRYYGRIERGAVNPTLETLLKLASVFGVTLEELFRFDFQDASLSEEAEEILLEVNKLIKDNDKNKIKKLKVFLSEILG